MKQIANWFITHPAWTAIGVLVAASLGVYGVFQDDGPIDRSISVYKVRADVGSWQASGIKLGPSDKARISPVGSWGVVDPNKRGTTGPRGNPVQAGPTYALSTPGSKESCLIVRVGDREPSCFSSLSGSELVTGPGEIVFRVNDDLDLRHKKNSDFQAFRDNYGFLRVFIEINPVEGD